jgi:hypothetical protein
VPQQALAEREGVALLVGRGLVLVDHLRLDLALLVLGEERVVDHVAVVADDVGGGPDRIEDFQIRMHHCAQGRLGKRGRGRRRNRNAGRTCGSKNDFFEHVHFLTSTGSISLPRPGKPGPDR